LKLKILYEAEVTELKLADQRKRAYRSILMAICESLFFVLLCGLLGIIFGITIFLAALFVFLPPLFIITPSRYQLTSQGIINNDQTFSPFRKGYHLHINEKRNFVSISHRWKGEILRLYSREPKRIFKILEQLFANL